MTLVITKNDGRQPTTFADVAFDPGPRTEPVPFLISGPKGGIAGEVRGRDNPAQRRARPRSAGVDVVLSENGVVLRSVPTRRCHRGVLVPRPPRGHEPRRTR